MCELLASFNGFLLPAAILGDWCEPDNAVVIFLGTTGDRPKASDEIDAISKKVTSGNFVKIDNLMLSVKMENTCNKVYHLKFYDNQILIL